MADTEKSCQICGGTEAEGELLLQAPCGRHWVCPDDIAAFFERATQTESLFPPKCCGQMFMLQEYEEYVPFDVAWAFQVKEQGDYSILAKFRVYCANPSCAKFLHPSSHVTDSETHITYAICEAEDCGKMTCVGCKTLLEHGTRDHACTKSEDEKKFKQTATEQGYMDCGVCGATVELAEACNHITCECGHDFCYICGKEWLGMHGCPHYGVATYDAEGYNQDGFHRATGLNRAGLTRRQEITRRRGEDPEEEDEEDAEEEEDPDWQVLQHLTPEQRVALNILEGEAREGALAQLQVQLFEEQGITFAQDPIFGQNHANANMPGQPQPQQGEDDEDEGEGEGEGEDEADDADKDGLEGVNMPVPQPTPNNPPAAAIPPAAQAEHGAHAPHHIANVHFRPDLFSLDLLIENEQNLARAIAAHNAVAVPNAPTDPNLETASLDSNASYVGSDVHERLAQDFPGPFVNERDGEGTPPVLGASPAMASEEGSLAASAEEKPLVGVQERKRTPYGGVPGAFPLDG